MLMLTSSAIAARTIIMRSFALMVTYTLLPRDHIFGYEKKFSIFALIVSKSYDYILKMLQCYSDLRCTVKAKVH